MRVIQNTPVAGASPATILTTAWVLHKPSWLSKQNLAANPAILCLATTIRVAIALLLPVPGQEILRPER